MSSRNQLSFEIYEKEVLNPLRGHNLTPVEEYVANLLLDASKQKPLRNSDICVRVKIRFEMKRLNPRTIKAVIRSLRKNHHFPVLASFIPPYGYWWCKSASEMMEYYEDAHARLKDELHTLSLMIRHNFPAYAGQLKLQEGEEHE